jgi:sarcosine oxidase subunit beta
VIGAGIIGCSVAHALSATGRSVVVVDRNHGPGQGSTNASSAIIRFNYSTLAGVATAWESHWSWLEWEEFLGGPDDSGSVARFWRTGSLCLDAPDFPSDRVLPLFDRVGVPYDVLTAAELRAAYPWLDPSRHYPPKPVDSEEFWADPHGEVGAYLTPDSGFIDDPGFAASNLASAARRRGVTFSFRSTVTGISRAHDRVSGVDLADGTHIDAPVVVNVSGPHSGHVNDLAGVSEDFVVGTRPMRVETHEVPAPPGFDQVGGPGPLVADLDLGTYFRGTPTGQLHVGGSEPACDPLQWIEDPDASDPGATRALYEAQTYRAARRLPDLEIPGRPRGIGAVYDVADDWIPIYDKTALPGFYVAIGTSGNQFKNAPLVGRYLTSIVEACEAGTDHDEAPVHVHLPHTGLELDLSAYSRRRQPNADSSNTVMG